jgi:hypothetical protein
MMAAFRATDRILPETRLVAAVVILILLLASISLYIFPDRTADHFAWTIDSHVTAMLIGAGYMAGIYFFSRVMLAHEWHRVAQGYLPITGFTVFMLAATLLHLDRFHQGQFEYYVWLIVYIITPVLVPAVWWRQRGEFSSALTLDDILVRDSTLIVLRLVGLALFAVSVVLFLDPALAIAAMPWKLTPLTARIAAGWGGLAALTLVSASTDARWSSMKILVESGLFGMVFYLIAMARGWQEFDGSPGTWIVLAVEAGLALIFAVSLVRMRPGT